MSSLKAALTTENGQLERMLDFVEHDPNNLRLIADTALLAAQAGEPEIVSQLVEKYEALAPLSPQLRNLRAQASMAAGHWNEAVDQLSALVSDAGPDPVLKFNLAWAFAMLSRHSEALTLLDEATVAASPRAPALRVHMMHHLGLFEEALAEADSLAERFPDNHELNGALAVLAIDGEDPEAARKFAERAADHSNEAATSLGTLLLNDFAVEEASAHFERALDLAPNDPRAHVGKGLALLTQGRAGALTSLDRGAELFGDHIGSWIAAGWAYFTQGDLARAKERFERALEIDENFAESHGALAVLDVLAGDIDGGQRRADVALRLDRQCYAAILAKSLLLENEGKAGAAEALRKRALAMPIDEGGMTITQALAGFGLKRGGKR